MTTRAQTSSITRDGIRFWPVTDVGRVRTHNEDAFLVDKKLRLFIVCDGMGGHAAGEVASNLAARAVRESLARERDLIAAFENQSSGVGREDIMRLLTASVQNACSEVYMEGQRDESKRGMGTTIALLLIAGNRGFIAHVGDSRVYLIRDSSVYQLTEDHSLVNELLKRGRLTREQIEQIQHKNAVTRAVGVYESVDVDTLDFDVLPGDRFLLCTDGLHGYFENAELAKIFSEYPDEKIAQLLVDLANERGGKDNITAIVVSIPEAQDQGATLAQELNLRIETLHQSPLCRFLTYQELVRVLNATSVREVRAGNYVVREGETGDELFIVLKGKIRIESAGTLLAELGPREHFGEMALLDRVPRSADAIASEDSALIVVKRKDFYDLVRQDHSIAVKLLWSFLMVLAGRLRSTSMELSEARDLLALRDRETEEGFDETMLILDEDVENHA
ncbi:MAG: Stp1/IreP family PP2C-type Ser/Thr phosphatase [Sandaracinaceae bacterium]|nr:Stp1/IreP family PP2C-type Ser/Thr phosphatase [Sandaracinaceae bacterium]MDW8244959.1 Stp1/IreP family PP2C-type Ser/Thr phosphatase [Sandaracinaceae bacterium]